MPAAEPQATTPHSGPSLAPRLGIIAGGGHAPQQLIDACIANNRPFYVIALQGQADAGLAEKLPHTWVPLGAGEALKSVVKEQGITELVMIGRVRRPSLVELKPDWLALKVLTKTGFAMLGDDGLLRGIGKAIEEETGARVIGAHQVFGDLLTPSGNLTRAQPNEAQQTDIKRGIDVARLIGAADIGQAAVVQQGLVLGVEGIEGTDALIARAGALQREGPRGVLVKMAKPQQDNRFDLPAMGPDTIRALHSAGLAGVAVEAGRSLLIDRAECLALADQFGVFVVGVQG